MDRSDQTDFNAMLERIGGFGKWQCTNFFILWLTSLAGGLAVVVFIFTAKTPPHRCPIPYCPDLTYKTDFINETSTLFKSDCSYKSVESLTIPLIPTKESCEEYLRQVQTNKGVYFEKCDDKDLLFDFSKDVTSSITSDNGWLCNNYFIKQIVEICYMIGMLVGSFLLGLLSDHYGRKPALMCAVILASIPPFIGAFANSTIPFGIMRFLTGIGGIGLFMVTFVMAVEYVSLKYTLIIGIAIEIPFAIGELILGIEAYFIRDWISLQLVAYTPIILLLLLWFIVPESPRWLVSKGKYSKAKYILAKAIEVNGKSATVDVDDIFEKFKMDALKEENSFKKYEKPSPAKLFYPKVIRLRTINMFYQWFAVTMVYYGLSFASTSLSGDAYTNFCLSVFIEIPAYIFCILVMDCWGRRPILSLCQLVAGICCIIAGLLVGSKDPAIIGLQICFSLLGKFGASACFAIVYVYTAELFPTPIRNTAVGSCSCIARIGGIFATLIQLTKVVWAPLPMLILGCVATIAGLLAFFFPETLGLPLPETMEQAINVKKGNRHLFTCSKPWWSVKELR